MLREISRNAKLSVLALVVGFVLMTASTAWALQPVQIWHTEPNPKTKAVIAEIIRDYEKLNPGIKIEQQPIGWGSLGDKLQAALAAGAPPDASHGQTYVERSLSAKGLLRPLDDLIASIGEDDIYDVVKRLDYHDGHYWGIAHAIGTDVIVYRKDLYRKAGLPDNKPSRDWKAWVSDLKKLTVDTNGDGVKDQYGLGLAGPGFFINEEVYMWTGYNGGRLFDPKGRPTFTEKPVIEMLELFKELNDCCLWPGWLNHGYPETFTMRAQGKVASILGWGRGAVEFEKYAPKIVKNGDFGVFGSKPVGPSGQDFLTQLDSEPWMVFKDAPHAEEAVDFLKFFYQKDNYRKYIQTVPIHFFPITKSMQRDPAYLNQTPEFKTWRFWVDAQQNIISQGRARPLLMTEWDDLELPYINEIAGSAILVDMVTDVVTGARSPQAAAKRAQSRAERLIEDLGEKRW